MELNLSVSEKYLSDIFSDTTDIHTWTSKFSVSDLKESYNLDFNWEQAGLISD